MSKRLHLTTVWVGTELPYYYNAWRETCERNADVLDVLMVTNVPSARSSNNVKVVQMTLPDIAARAARVLGTTVVLDVPYKMCDLKPFYMDIFGEFIAKRDAYTMLGFCDMDMVFGRLGWFYETTHWDDYDVVGFHGHMMLFHNKSEVISTFRSQHASEIRDVLGRKGYQVLDEGLFRAYCFRRYFTSHSVRFPAAGERCKIPPIFEDEPSKGNMLSLRYDNRIADVLPPSWMPAERGVCMCLRDPDPAIEKENTEKNAHHRTVSYIGYRGGKLLCDDHEIVYAHFQRQGDAWPFLGVKKST